MQSFIGHRQDFGIHPKGTGNPMKGLRRAVV